MKWLVVSEFCRESACKRFSIAKILSKGVPMYALFDFKNLASWHNDANSAKKAANEILSKELSNESKIRL